MVIKWGECVLDSRDSKKLENTTKREFYPYSYKRSVAVAYLLSKTRVGFCLLGCCKGVSKNHIQEHIVSLGTWLVNSVLNRGKKASGKRCCPRVSQMRDVGRNYLFPFWSWVCCWGSGGVTCYPTYSTEGDLAAFSIRCHLSQSAFGNKIKMPKSHFCALTTALCAQRHNSICHWCSDRV